MESPQLQNYLTANRKRLALSQDEVAFLIGERGAAQVSRYERFHREPSLRAALALEAVFKISASELFGGLYAQVEKEVAERAKILSHRKDSKTNKRIARNRETITNLST